MADNARVDTFTYNGTTQYSKVTLTDTNVTLPEVTITAKKIKSTDPVPNPLSDFASYSYALSLWWLDTADYNTLANAQDIDEALAWNPGPYSFVVAEDSGLYPDRRLPDSPGLNYNIQDFTFNSVITPTKTRRSSNVLDGSMTIIEPYGVTFIDQLVAASGYKYGGNRFNNYTQQVYMLQVDFRGYDDNGDPIPDSQMATFRKRFPVKILSMAVSVTHRGAEYKLTFCSAGAVAHYPGTHTATPKIFTITADTVGEFFKQLSNCYYTYHVQEVGLGKAEYVEAVKFDIDPLIRNSPIVNQLQVPLPKANARAEAIDVSKSTFTIPAGTPILDIITKIMAHSTYMHYQLVRINSPVLARMGGEILDTDYFTSFKTTTAVSYEGRNVDGEVVNEGVVDVISNRWPMTTTYKIHQYPVWSGTHPNMPQYPDSRKFSTKKYDYFYSGKNTEVIDFKLNFDTTYYTAVQAYTSAIAATESSQQTAADAADNTPVNGNNSSHPISVNSSVLASGIPMVTQNHRRNIVKDMGASSGLNLSSNPRAQIAADVMSSIYKTLNGDMLTIDLNIIGDPTLIKQDDWLYCPSPSLVGSTYNQWDTMGQYEYAAKYGAIRTDTGEVVVAVTLNTPVDVDTETRNQGLMDPVPTYTKSLFSGQYTILQIHNKFAGGKFEQTLELARIINGDIAKLFSPNGGAVADSQANQTALKEDNNQTPAEIARLTRQDAGVSKRK
jgi:hypothetical protein